VELGTAVLWGVILVAWGVGIQSIHTIVFLSLLLAIALSDARFYRIPNPLSLGGAMAGVFLQALPGGSGMGTALLGSLGAMFVMQAIRWTGSRALGREAMGGGDVRMMALIGAFLGFEGAMGAVFLASALGLVVFAPTPGRTGRLIPFGVFLAVAGAFVWLVDPSLFTRSGRPFSIS
jgi:leader peptidase (prepilin peptidase)/N-methyltransferase